MAECVPADAGNPKLIECRSDFTFQDRRQVESFSATVELSILSGHLFSVATMSTVKRVLLICTAFGTVNWNLAQNHSAPFGDTQITF
jgi:hypothetical protein